MPEPIDAVWAYLPGILALLLLSSFFSGSEAAFFSLTPGQRRSLAKGNRATRLAHALLKRADRLLMGVLFWNLAINIGYFTLVSRVGLAVDALPSGSQDHTGAALTAVAALIAIIIFGEFLPKSLAMLYPMVVVQTVAFPLTFAIRILDGFLPIIRIIHEASRRLLWPGLKPEPYLELSDLDRAVALSSDESQLYETERQVLRNVIQLSEIRVEEWMRPRTQYRAFKPPVSISQLGGEKPPSGYMLVTDAEGQEVVSAIDLPSILPHQTRQLGNHLQPLVVVPWCATIADALKRLRDKNYRVAVVVNEFGETIGILTWEEIFEAIFQMQNTRSHRELAKAEVHLESPGVWVATGMTKLRRLERVMGRRFAASKNLTVGGVVQEQLHRLPEEGDRCNVEDLQLEVIETGIRGEILVRISATSAAPEEPS